LKHETEFETKQGMYWESECSLVPAANLPNYERSSVSWLCFR